MNDAAFGMQPAATWGYVDHCPVRPGQGFMSNAKPPQKRGCAPGFVPAMCDTTRRITFILTAAAVDTVKIGSWQPLQPLAIVDVGSGASVAIDDMRVNGQPIFTKFDDNSTVTGSLVAGLGTVSDLTFEAIRSGANPFPPSPLTDNVNKLEIDISGTATQVADFFIYFGNPANNSNGRMVGNMQKNGGANYYG